MLVSKYAAQSYRNFIGYKLKRRIIATEFQFLPNFQWRWEYSRYVVLEEKS